MTGFCDPDEVAIALDGTRVTAQRFRLVIATTLDRLFLKMNPFWGRERAPIRFTALEPDGRKPVKNVIRVLRGVEPVDEAGATESGYTSHNVFTSRADARLRAHDRRRELSRRDRDVR